jgi:hypothetical protein
MKILTAEGQKLQDEFDALYIEGDCRCHIIPPCHYCTHPGNPTNLAEREDLWEEVDSINNE